MAGLLLAALQGFPNDAAGNRAGFGFQESAVEQRRLDLIQLAFRETCATRDLAAWRLPAEAQQCTPRAVEVLLEVVEAHRLGEPDHVGEPAVDERGRVGDVMWVNRDVAL